MLYDGGDDDDFGYDDGIRDFPASVQQAINRNLKLDRSNFDVVQLSNIGREFENSKLWVIQKGEVPLNSSFNFTYGNELDIAIDEVLGDSSATFGVMFTAGLRSSWKHKMVFVKLEHFRLEGDGTANVIVSNDKTFMSTSNDVTSYAMSVLGIDTDSYELKYTGMYIHKGTKRARVLQGYDSSDAGNVRRLYRVFEKEN